MLFNNIDYSKKYDYTLILTKKNKEPIAILSEAFNREFTRTSESFDVIKCDIPYDIIDTLTHQQVVNPHYKSIIEENMILLKVGDIEAPLFQGYYVIKVNQQKSDTHIKHIEASSREITLNKNLLTTLAMERPLYDTASNDGILNLLEQETSWRVGYVSPSALIDDINGGTVPRVRYLSASSQPWFQFLHDTISTSYNVIFQFDSYNKLVNVYDRDNYGIKTPLILSESNYIMDINRTTKTDNVVTKLTVSGANGLGIASVNIFGNDSVYDYSYFINNGQMSVNLITAWNTYQSVLTTQNTVFQGLVTQLNTLNTSLVTANSTLSTLKETLKGQLGIQQAYISSGDNTNLPTATANVNATNASITTTQNSINNLNIQITALQTQMATITNNIQKENVKDNNGILIFNTDLLTELEDWTMEETWSDNTQTVPNLLMKAGKTTLFDYCVPEIQYSMTLVDMLALPQFQQYQGCLNIGDFVMTYSERLGISEWCRIIGYTYNIDTNSLSITFSNKNKSLQNSKGLASAISKSVTTSNLVNNKKLIWEQIENTSNAVNVYMNNAFDCAKQEILSENGDNRININENGITVSSVSNPNNQIKILSSKIAFTTDSWNSVNTLMDNSGLYAKYLVGQILLGTNLFIANTSGTFSVTGSTFQMKSALTGNSVLVDANLGIASCDNIYACDNVDGSNSLSIRFKIDENVNLIQQVLLKVSYQAFRSYETAVVAASGGSITTGSSPNGDHKHMFLKYGGTDSQYSQYVFTASNSGGGYTNVQMGSDSAPPSDLYTYGSSGNHVHTVNTTHGHEVTITRGIYTDRIVGNTNIAIDGSIRIAGNIPTETTHDVTPWLSKGWHTVTINCDGLGRISASLYLKTYISM